MTGYLLDSTALWRMLRDEDVLDQWQEVIADGELRSCYPQRAEFLYSARNLDEYAELCRLFDESTRDTSVPKSAGLWIGRFQDRAAKGGCLNCLSAVDLQICATAAHHGLIVVHDDRDFVTAAGFACDVREVNVHAGPLKLGF